MEEDAGLVMHRCIGIADREKRQSAAVVHGKALALPDVQTRHHVKYGEATQGVCPTRMRHEAQ